MEQPALPFASHGLYTQPGLLDVTKPEERERSGGSPDNGVSGIMETWRMNRTVER